MALKLLILATKAPWPPVDGGRLLLAQTLEGLAAAGVRPTLVAPVDPRQFDLERVAAELSRWCVPRLVPAAPAPPVRALLSGWRVPLSIARHSLPAVRREAGRLLDTQRFDLVHAEQLQALPQAAPAFARSVPVVLRAQNVESDLWAAASARQPGWEGKVLAEQARRLARWEGEEVQRVAATFALTPEDAARLRELAPGSRIRVLRAPFPERPPGTGQLPGEPAVVVMGSRGWLPNEEAAGWFLDEAWPAVRSESPGAVLHLFGMEREVGERRDVLIHPSPEDSAEAFPPGSILVVPLRIASGVRMKVLEAWARGVPVVGTPAALAGLDVTDGREALVARSPQEFAHAISRIHREPGLAASLIQAGHQARHERHDPARVAAEMVAAYEEALTPGPSPNRPPTPPGEGSEGIS